MFSTQTPTLFHRLYHELKDGGTITDATAQLMNALPTDMRMSIIRRVMVFIEQPKF